MLKNKYTAKANISEFYGLKSLLVWAKWNENLISKSKNIVDSQASKRFLVLISYKILLSCRCYFAVKFHTLKFTGEISS